MDKNSERGVFHIPRKHEEALEQAPIEQFETINIRAVQLKGANNKNLSDAKKEILADYKFFIEVGEKLEACRERALGNAA